MNDAIPDPQGVAAWLSAQAGAVRKNRYTRAFDMDAGHLTLTRDDIPPVQPRLAAKLDHKLDTVLSECRRYGVALDSTRDTLERVLPPKPTAVKASARVARADAASAIDINTKLNALSWELHQAQQCLDAANQADPLNPPEPQIWNPADHERNFARTAAAGGQDGGKIAAVVDVEGFSGRPIRTFYGDIGVMMAPFSNPRRYVTRFLTGGR